VICISANSLIERDAVSTPFVGMKLKDCCSGLCVMVADGVSTTSVMSAGSILWTGYAPLDWRSREYTDLVRQGTVTLTKRRALLAAHRARVEENIQKWTEALELIDAKIEFYGEWAESGERPAIEPHKRARVPKRGSPRSLPRRPRSLPV
jgi:hypothetical protein